MTIVSNGKFRIQTITKLDRGEVNSAWVDAPIAEGLGIEKKYENLDSYYVVCYVKYNEKEGCAEIESISNRILDIELADYELYKEMVKAAIKLVEVANLEVD